MIYTCWSCHHFLDCKEVDIEDPDTANNCLSFVREPGTDEEERVCELCGSYSHKLTTGICNECWKKYRPRTR